MPSTTPNVPTRDPLIPGFKGVIARRNDNPEAWDKDRYQYATSSHDADSQMNPASILWPLDDDDVILALKYAEEKKIGVAIRTGGHQYSGASSTAGENIQLDLSRTYPGFVYNETTGTVRAGISHTLTEFNQLMGQNKLFVPHGQCSHVHLGGHVHTGGYGQLGRAFGLFGDHIEELELIMPNGKKRVVKKTSTDPEDVELFFAVLGGSPGNFGVLTHVVIKPYHDSDHPDSRGFKALYWYHNDTMKRILDVMVKMSNDDDYPADYDVCMTMLSSSAKVIRDFFPGVDQHMRENHPDVYGTDGLPNWPPAIIVYAQYANLDGAGQQYNSQLIDELKKAGGFAIWTTVNDTEHVPMSELTRQWVFMNVREFQYPYHKRAYVTNSKTLVEDEWTQVVCKRIDEIQGPVGNGCMLSVQIQPFGGKHSRYRQKRINANGIEQTSYSWRADSTFVCVLDCFYDNRGLIFATDSEKTARDWQEQNDKVFIGENGKFCKEDRRFLWGSFGDRNLDKIWRAYYDSKEKYDRLVALKRQFDPDRVLTANEFCVGGGRPSTLIVAPEVQMLAATASTIAAVVSPKRWDDARHTQRIHQDRSKYLRHLEEGRVVLHPVRLQNQQRQIDTKTISNDITVIASVHNPVQDAASKPVWSESKEN